MLEKVNEFLKHELCGQEMTVNICVYIYLLAYFKFFCTLNFADSETET